MENQNQEKWNESLILSLDHEDQRYGHIYIIKCKESGKNYVGQAISHRLNNDKYRYYGYIGRFKGHICEAVKNTKKTGGCTYLNSAIRKYGEEQFTVELIEKCKFDEMDDREEFYIKEYNTIAPNGYNITKGGKGVKGWVNPKLFDQIDETGVNPILKRGREFGYKHKDETKQKIKDRYLTMTEEESKKRKTTMRDTMSSYHKDKRVNMLLNLGIEFDEDFKKYIRPKMKNDKIVGYVIRINRARHGEITNKDIPVDKKYEMLYEALEEAYDKQQENKKNIVPPKKVIKKVTKVTKDEK